MTMQYPITIEFLGTPGAGKTTLIDGLEHQLESSVSGVTMSDASELLPREIFEFGTKEANEWIRLKTAQRLLEFKELKRSGQYDIAFVDQGYVNALFMEYFYSTSYPTIKGIDYKKLGLVPPDFAVVLIATPLQVMHRGETKYTREKLRSYNKALEEFFHDQMPCRNFMLDTTHLTKKEMIAKVHEVISRELP